MEDYKDKQAREFKLLKVENVNLPCKKCDSDCCGPDVPFTIDEIKEIEKVVSLKKFKKTDLIDGVKGSVILTTKGVKNDKCVFLKNNRCSIYKVRPEICKDFGEKIYIQCAFNGLKEIPADKDERTRLIAGVQNIFYNKMSEIYGFRINTVPYTAKNVIV